MFGALLFLDSSVLFLVKNRGASSIQEALEARQENSSESATESPAEVGHFAHYALWVASISLGVTMTCMTGIALLNRNLDPPKTLVINSRLLRIAPRLPATIFIICLPLIPGMNGGNWCGAAVSLLYIIFLWEWLAGLERDWRFFEPKDE
jgi:hypothetical protein